jgi:hypothetical protein
VTTSSTAPRSTPTTGPATCWKATSAADRLFGGRGDDWLVGGEGDDRLASGAGVNVLDGGVGFDLADFAQRTTGVWVDLSAGHFSSADTWATFIGIEGVIGGSGADALYGGLAGDALFGGLGFDVLDGRAGDDDLRGEGGDDYLVGGEGADRLTGGAGVDTLTGGAGADVFDLGVAAGWDVIRDFSAAEDRIDLGGLRFEFIGTGRLRRGRRRRHPVDLRRRYAGCARRQQPVARRMERLPGVNRSAPALADGQSRRLRISWDRRSMADTASTMIRVIAEAWPYSKPCRLSTSSWPMPPAPISPSTVADRLFASKR